MDIEERIKNIKVIIDVLYQESNTDSPQAFSTKIIERSDKAQVMAFFGWLVTLFIAIFYFIYYSISNEIVIIFLLIHPLGLLLINAINNSERSTKKLAIMQTHLFQHEILSEILNLRNELDKNKVISEK